MTIKRYGSGSAGAGKQPLPFARAVEADGWLYVSGQVAMENGEIVAGGIVAQSRRAIENMIAILRIGVWLDDPRDFWSFNGVYAEYFGENPPARAAVQSQMMVDCKIEIDCVAFRADRKAAAQ